MDALKRKRTRAKGLVTSLKKSVDALDPVTVTLPEVELYIERCRILFTNTNSIVNDIMEKCKDDEVDAHQAEYEVEEKRLDAIELVLRGHITRLSSTSSSRTGGGHSSTHAPPAADIKLPVLPMPNFDGEICNWPSFRDLFTSTVINHATLSNAQKLQYLKSHVQGEALKLIQSISITNTNFKTAWDKLKARFDKEKEMVFAMIHRIMSQPKVTERSAAALRSLIDTTSECLSALENMKQPTDQWDTIIVYVIQSKLDDQTRQAWELSRTDNAVPKLDKVIEFIDNYAQSLVSASADLSSVNDAQQSSSQSTQRSNFKKTVKSHHASTSGPTCYKCGQSHLIYHCPEFIKFSIPDRVKFAKSKSLCENCLRPGHDLNQCKKGSCRKCSARHNSMLHSDSPSQPQSKTVLTASYSEGQALLATAIIQIHDSNGQLQKCRALLDSGSEGNFITYNCVERLGLHKFDTHVNINGVSSSSVTIAEHRVKFRFSSLYNAKLNLHCNAMVLPQITGKLPSSLVPKSWPHIESLQLADPQFEQPGEIDILIGAELFADILLEGIRRGPEGSPIAQHTTLGWILFGRTETSKQSTIRNFHVTCAIDQAVRRFWEQEELSTPELTPEHLAAEHHFATTHTRDSNGRYVVQLPMKDDISLGASKEQALRRFYSLEKKLQANASLRQQYNAFMQEYIDLGHMELVPQEELDNPSSPVFYLPHHAVLKEASTTTQCRVVFDGSAKSSSGHSLNDLQLVGPTLQGDIFTTLTRFRFWLFPFVGDIKQMYRQILLHFLFRNYVRIFWRFDKGEKIQEYWLLTVTYGTASAPSLAIMVIRQIAIDYTQEFREAATIILRDMYVDDLASGTDNEDLAIKLIRDIIQMFKKGCMEIRKWASNTEKILASIPSELRASPDPIKMQLDQSIKTLGLIWSPGRDTFSFNYASLPAHKRITKRTVLSDIASLFDPLGLLAPVTVKAKIFLQSLWKEPLSWDDSLTSHLLEEWTNYKDDLPSINQMSIPRCLKSEVGVKYELHSFSDASEVAYGGCVYLRTIYSSREISVRLIAAKTKVAPIKKVTIPRLELCGALLVCQLWNNVNSALQLGCDSFFWSDSTITLHWIKGSQQHKDIYIANRVTKIQQLSPSSQWYHVRGIENPADLASRGLFPSQIEKCKLWWEGPEFLKESQFVPPPFESTYLPESSIEVLHQRNAVPFQLPERFSSLIRLMRVVGIILRQVHNLRNTEDKWTGPLSYEELDSALLRCVKLTQQHIFSKEMCCLGNQQQIPSQSRLLPLNPFLSHDGLLRVGGRLRHAKLKKDQKYPIILPQHSHLTQLILRFYHSKNLHCGPQSLLNTVQQRFWIINGKKIARNFVRRCVKCYRHNSSPSVQLMSDLPRERVTSTEPFIVSGVDYAGPLLLKSWKGRNPKIVKSYIAVFVCFSTKAVHLEVVSDLSTESFLAALRRFISRRGHCHQIHSDCGSNFIGAKKELAELVKLASTPQHNNEVSNFLTSEGITWKFNPPSSPNFGGLWEASVKSMKHHLKRVVGDTHLTFEEMTTFLTQVEACLNSRPLTPMSSDPNDLQVLTPGHFLIRRPMNALVQPDYTEVKSSRLGRWEHIQQMTQHFWNRWTNEVLLQMQQRFKWKEEQPNIPPGSMVLVKDERLPPQKWRLGRILSTHPESENKNAKVRVVKVRTCDGTYVRPISKLCLLPIENTVDVTDSEK